MPTGLTFRFTAGARSVDTTIGGSSSTDVALNFSRLASGAGTTRVMVGIPLQPGQLFPGGAKRIEVGGAEVAATFQEGAWLHSDGSLAVLRAQCDRTLTNGTPEAAVLKIGTTAALTGPTWTAPSWPAVTASNYQTATILSGVGLPTSATQLCASQVFGPLIPESQTPVSPAFLQGVESILTTNFSAYYADWVGSNFSGNLGAGGSQYDRPGMCLQKWARTGDIVWMQRALATYAAIRELYLVPASWNANEQAMETYSIALMDALFGESSACWNGLADVSKPWSSQAYSSWIAWGLPWSRILSDANGGTTPAVSYSGQYGTSCRAICYNFARLSALIRSGRGSTVVTYEGATAEATLIALLNRWLTSEVFNATLGNPAGLRNIIGSVTPGTAPFVSPVQHFQQGLTICILHDIVKWHSALLGTTLTNDVIQRIRDLTEYLWTQYRDLAADTLFYTDVSASHGAINDVNVDSNGWYATAFYWMYAKGYGSQWRDRGDLLYAGLAGTPRNGTDGPYCDANIAVDNTVKQKHLNQIHQYGLRGIALRGGVL
jgi:hypothetical protein